MARVSMKDRAAQLRPVATPEADEGETDAATGGRVVGGTPVDSTPDAPVVRSVDAPTSRINFEVDRRMRAAFKVWCAQNDTTIKDELTAHIEQRIRSTQ